MGSEMCIRDSSTDRSTDCSIDSSTERSTDRSTGGSTDRSTDRSTDCSIDRSTDRSIDGSTDRSTDHSAGRSISTGLPTVPSRQDDVRVLCVLLFCLVWVLCSRDAMRIVTGITAVNAPALACAPHRTTPKLISF